MNFSWVLFAPEELILMRHARVMPEAGNRPARSKERGIAS
jgi:hypothetical protein